MPIDSALEQLPDGEKPKAEDAILKDEAFMIFREYPSMLKEFAKNDLRKFNLEYVSAFSKFMRFSPQLHIIFPSIPKDEIIKIATRGDPSLERTLRGTDLGSGLPENLFVIGWINKSKIPEFFGVDNLYNLCSLSNSCFLIPDLKFLSLFMENGALVRDYARLIQINGVSQLNSESEDDPEPGSLDARVNARESKFFLKLLQKGTGKLIDENLFSLENLSRFHSSSGNAILKPMVEEYYEIKEEIKDRLQVSLGITLHCNINVRDYLFSRLKKYNPQLTHVRETKTE